MNLSSALSISVIIPVYNGGEIFRQCLSALSTSQERPQEVIVVADGDTDNSWQVATNWGAKVIRVEEKGDGTSQKSRCICGSRRYPFFCGC